MNIEEFRWHCLSKPVVTEEFPFDQSTTNVMVVFTYKVKYPKGRDIIID